MAFFAQQLSLALCLVVLVSFVCSELVCDDKTKSCKKWSVSKNLCDENQKYKEQRFFVSMSRLCKKSCLMCGDDDASLFDTDSRCNSYFRKGYCDQKPHQGFMLRRCKYSCRNTIRSGIMSPGRGNFQRNNPPAQAQQQGYWNQQQQADNRYPQQYGQQYAQQYSQQYGYAQNDGHQQAQNYGQQHDQQQAQNYGQQHDQQQAQNNGQHQYPQQYAQQNDAHSQQTAGQQQPQAQQQVAGQQQPQAQQQGTQSLSDLPVQVQALSNPDPLGTGSNPSRKHKLEKKHKHHHHHDSDMDNDDYDGDNVDSATDDDMD